MQRLRKRVGATERRRSSGNANALSSAQLTELMERRDGFCSDMLAFLNSVFALFYNPL